MKTLSILGSTGSIGTQTLDVVRQHPEDFAVAALAAGSNIDLLEQQIREFSPALAAVWDEKRAKELKVRVRDQSVRVVSGMDGILEAACLKQSSLVVAAMVGMIGIRPAMEAIQSGKDLALANKETLVTAGHLIMPLAKSCGVRILPVDSEHSAIFQCLQGNEGNPVRRILLTASGGTFRGKKRQDLETVTWRDALKNPNWDMGPKVTVDSASMVNKGLEVIEARWLFDVTPDQIEVLVHPQSIVHSAVEFADHAVIAQMGTPDMRIPIQYALMYPQRKVLETRALDLFTLSDLHFEKPDLETFRGPAFAFEALRAGGSMPTVFNAANEKAVALFAQGKIGFLQIYDLIEACMAAHRLIPDPSLDEVLETETWTYEFINRQFPDH